MGRRRRRNRSSQRDHNTIATTVLRNPMSLSPVPVLSDRRAFHPDGFFSPVSSARKWQRAIVEMPNVNTGRSNARGRVPKRGFHFAVPDAVSVCVRRKQRREVLFAFRRTGKGSRSLRKRNYWTDVRC